MLNKNIETFEKSMILLFPKRILFSFSRSIKENYYH